RPELEDRSHRILPVAHRGDDLDAVLRDRARDRVEDGRVVVGDDTRDPRLVRRATALSVESSRHASTIRTRTAWMVALGVHPLVEWVRLSVRAPPDPGYPGQGRSLLFRLAPLGFCPPRRVRAEGRAAGNRSPPLPSPTANAPTVEKRAEARH